MIRLYFIENTLFLHHSHTYVQRVSPAVFLYLVYRSFTTTVFCLLIVPSHCIPGKLLCVLSSVVSLNPKDFLEAPAVKYKKNTFSEYCIFLAYVAISTLPPKNEQNKTPVAAGVSFKVLTFYV